LRNGVIHTGAAALMLGAALAMNTARAADNDVDDAAAQPAPPPPRAPAAAVPSPAPASPSAHAVPAPPAAPAAAPRASSRTRDAARDSADAERELADRLREAQERMNQAASEVAEIAAQRAAEAMEAVPPFIDAHTPRRTIIGVDLDPQSRDGAKVLDVSPGGPAEQAGIRPGDVITMVNGKAVEGGGDKPGQASRFVTRQLRGLEPDTKVKVRVLRDGKPKDFEVVARSMAPSFVFQGPGWQGQGGSDVQVNPFNFNYQFFGSNNDLAGLEVTTLTPQLGRYFGASKGVLVLRAPKSDVYKLQDGDVIESIDGREPTNGSHITRILSSYQPGEELTLRVMRDHKSQDIKVTVPQRQRNRQSRIGTMSWDGV
jgi:C-terminal processing protease CtpA/Prc